MLDYSELTIVKNADGVSTALGYPVNSLLLQNNRPLFVGGGGKRISKAMTDHDTAAYETADFSKLAIPAGLVCMTQTVCTNNAMDYYSRANEEQETIPEGLYEQLLALAESKAPKKLTKRHNEHRHGNKKQKNKTKRNNK